MNANWDHGLAGQLDHYNAYVIELEKRAEETVWPTTFSDQIAFRAQALGAPVTTFRLRFLDQLAVELGRIETETLRPDPEQVGA